MISCDPLVNAWKELDPRRKQILLDTLLAAESDLSKGILKPCIAGLAVDSSSPLELQAIHLELRSHLGDNGVVDKACVLGDRLASVAKATNIEAVRTPEVRIVAAIVRVADAVDAGRIERWRNSKNAELNACAMILVANRAGEKARFRKPASLFDRGSRTPWRYTA